MKEIKLTRGYTAIIDDEDYEKVKNIKWHYALGYAVCSIPKNGKRVTVSMHRTIMDIPDGMEADHINRNKLDNRRGNLRTATRAQNNQNQALRKDNRYGFKGVWERKERNKFRVRIKVNKECFYFGTYYNIVDAALAYNLASLKYHGEYGYLNKIPRTHQPSFNAIKNYIEKGLLLP